MFGRRSTSSQPALPVLAPLTAPAAEELPPEATPLWEPPAPEDQRSVEHLLLSRGHVTEEMLVQAREVAATSPGRSIWQILLSMHVIGEAQALSAVAETLGLPFEQPTPDRVDPEAFRLLPADYCRKHGVAALRFEGKKLVMGSADPNDIFLRDEVQTRTSRELSIVATPAGDIERLVEQMTSPAVETHVDQMLDEVSRDNEATVRHVGDPAADLEQLSNDSPVIRFVNYLIAEAVRHGASDIHIEPKEKSLRIRYRVDGLLFETMSPPASVQAAVVSRLKIMANLDIAERRLPQDGRVRAVAHGRPVELRLSTLPTPHGEKCVLRILDNRSINVSLDDLGFGENAYTIWKRQIAQPHGILLVTGPTGSGKTTTLYASLRCMDFNRLNISTVEDPIEYHLDAATQVQVHEKIGMTFSAALRSLLRQDPDVVMVGEIRDQETANIAVQAALTGHLVLSTLHTNDASSTVTRLINIGVEPYHISAAVNAILAQRLVRRICPHCREPFSAGEEMAEFLMLQGLQIEKLYHGRGCDRCRQTGYSGRLGVYELLVMDDALRDVITKNPDVNHLRRLCRERGLVSLREDGFQKAMKGLTTVEEVLRVTDAS